MLTYLAFVMYNLITNCARGAKSYQTHNLCQLTLLDYVSCLPYFEKSETKR